MPDKKNSKVTQDKQQALSETDYELYYLEEKLGVSREQVMAAIAAVGRDRHQVEGYLRTHQKPD